MPCLVFQKEFNLLFIIFAINSSSATPLSVNRKHWLLSNITDKDCGSVDRTMAVVSWFCCFKPWCISIEFSYCDERGYIKQFAKALNIDQPIRF